MKLPYDVEFIYVYLVHETRHVYDFKHNPDIDMYTLESNAYRLSLIALDKTGIDKMTIDEYAKRVNEYLLTLK
jgi:hypothetical protein